MSYLEYRIRAVPTGFKKILYINWPIVLLIFSIGILGFVMLYSVAGGSFSPWAAPQIKRFTFCVFLMFFIAMTPIWFWRNMSFLSYFIAIVLLILVSFIGSKGMGAQRWLDLGFIRLQPSELVKIGLVMVLASYYEALPRQKISKPFWVIIPIVIILIPSILVLKQPDLGTSILLVIAGGTVMFLAGVHWIYFFSLISGIVGGLFIVFRSRHTPWQILKDYQYKRIDTFLDPASDPLGAGYHITQSKIALGSGAFTGRGFMQGTQSRLNFLPEKHTDFIFTTLAEEFGFIGGLSLLLMYLLLLLFCIISAINVRDRYSSLLIMGCSMNFFLFFAVNMSMVMGLAPVVGVPLPLISYGGSAMLVLMVSFGLIQSAHVHRPRFSK